MSGQRIPSGWATPRRLAALLAVLTGLTVYLLAHEVFPYHTVNHDEGVYLQQAELLLSGQLTLEPPVVEAFRPWFFVADGSTLYPKYAPVTAAMFAVGEILGGFRIALAVIAAAVVALTYAVVAEVFDRQTGLVAGLLLAVSPLFLVQASVFLPYVPTFAWILLFGWAYFRADRTGDVRFAALAGLAIGVGFFARPYTAVLFATPFIVHALWSLRTLDRPAITRQVTTAALGLCGVGIALGYNALVTGSPLVFPYEAFAPLDGPGFGHREILGYERTYTPVLALEAQARALRQYVTAWTPGGAIGGALAVVGIVGVATRALGWPSGWDARRPPIRPLDRVAVLAGIVLSVTLGQWYFWGTLNALGNLGDPTDGLIALLGPYYHLPLLLPTVGFAAYALVILARWLRARLGDIDSRAARSTALAGVVVVAGVAGVTAVGAVSQPLSANAEVTEQYERAYEPVENADFENALVFLPGPYGDWLNHPFQHFRNEPDYDGNVVYALQTRQFDVVDAFPDRQLYRYTYRGEWTPQVSDGVTPRLQRIGVTSGERVSLSVTAGVPEYAEGISLRAETSRADYAAVGAAGDEVTLSVTVTDGRAIIDSQAIDEPVSLPVDGRETVRMRLFVDYGTIDSFSYLLEVPVQADDGTYEVLTPRTEVCRNPRLCDGEAAYVPGQHRDGVHLNVTTHD